MVVVAMMVVAGPGVTLIVAVWVRATPPAVADIVRRPVTVEEKLPLACPLALVGPGG